jgi:ATP-binding cassette subfamily B protein
MRVRLRIFKRIAIRPDRPSDSGRYGLTMTRLISDLNSLRNWVSVGVARALVAAITGTGVLLTLLYLDVGIGLAAVGIVALCGLLGAALTPTLRRRVREARKRRGRLASNLGEKVFAFRTVRHFGRTARELRRVDSQSRRLRDSLVARTQASQALRGLPDLVYPLGIASIVWLSHRPGGTGWRGSSGTVAVLLLALLASSLRGLARAWDYRLSFAEGHRRISTILRSPRLSERQATEDLPGEGPVGFAFDGVSAGEALQDVSLEVAPGERVLLTGPAGSGKSLLLALAARLLDPESGTVRLGGRPIQRLSLDAVHEAVQLVAPDLPLLRGTVAENLGYGIEGETRESIEEAARRCALLEEPGLPQGLETRLEERGANLSSGLRARVALARAVVARPRLLLVDDPAFVSDTDARAALRRVAAELPVTLVAVGPEGSLPVAPDRILRLDPSSESELRRPQLSRV